MIQTDMEINMDSVAQNSSSEEDLIFRELIQKLDMIATKMETEIYMKIENSEYNKLTIVIFLYYLASGISSIAFIDILYSRINPLIWENIKMSLESIHIPNS